MSGRDTNPRTGAPLSGDETWPALESLQDEDSTPDLLSPSQILRRGDAPRRPAIEHDGDEEIGDTDRLPRVLRMPESIKVEEKHVGRAVAQWILHVRCECGRRWFEVEAIDSTHCPRCGMLVYVDVDARGARR